MLSHLIKRSRSTLDTELNFLLEDFDKAERGVNARVRRLLPRTVELCISIRVMYVQAQVQHPSRALFSKCQNVTDNIGLTIN